MSVELPPPTVSFEPDDPDDPYEYMFARSVEEFDDARNGFFEATGDYCVAPQRRNLNSLTVATAEMCHALRMVINTALVDKNIDQTEKARTIAAFIGSDEQTRAEQLNMLTGTNKFGLEKKKHSKNVETLSDDILEELQGDNNVVSLEDYIMIDYTRGVEIDLSRVLKRVQKQKRRN